MCFTSAVAGGTGHAIGRTTTRSTPSATCARRRRIADGYEVGSCLKYAEQLKGKLLIVHGMVDDNVHPNNIWQLIDLFQKADKPFDMMLYPN